MKKTTLLLCWLIGLAIGSQAKNHNLNTPFGYKTNTLKTTQKEYQYYQIGYENHVTSSGIPSSKDMEQSFYINSLIALVHSDVKTIEEFNPTIDDEVDIIDKVNYPSFIPSFNSYNEPSTSNSIEEVVRSVHVNFHGGADGVALAPAPWNNVTGAPTAGNSIPDMLDHTGASSGIGIELLDTWDLEGNTGAASGVYPPEVTRSFYFENDMATKRLKVSGLDITRTYSFEFFASRAGVSGQRLTHYTIGAQTVSLDAVNNTGEVARISGVLPDANGEVTIQVVKDAASSFAYINSLVIEENGVVDAPTSVTAHGDSEATAEIAWAYDHAGATGFEVHRSLELAGGYALVGTTGASELAYADTGLEEGTTYYYKVRAVKGAGHSEFSTVVYTITKGGLRVIHVNFHGGADGVALAPAPWNNVTGAPTAGNSIPDMLDHTGASSGIGIELLDTWDLEGNTGAASGVYPPEVTRSFYFENDMATKRLKVSGLDITRTYSFEFFASRAGVSGQRLTHYTIGAQTVSLDAVNNTGEVARISGVLPDANGEVTIQVVKDAASSFAYINSLVIEENGVVDAPTSVTAHGDSEATAEIAWAYDHAGATGFEVHRSLELAGGYALVGTTGASELAYADTGLEEGTTYYYKVRAVKGAGHSEFSTVVYTITKGGLRVIHVNFHGGADGVALAPAPWNNVTGAPTAGNSIPDMLDHTGASSGIGIELLDTWDLEGNTGAASGVYPPEVTRSFYFENDMATKRLKVSGLDITRTYSFEFFASRAGVSGQRLTHYTIGAQTVSLDAVNNTGEVARISGVLPDANGEVTIQVVKDAASSFAYINSLVIEENGVVDAPTSVTAHGDSEATAEIAWAYDHAGATGFEVHRSLELAGGYALVGTTGASELAYADTGLEEGTTYYYKVRAVKGAGHSEFSTVVYTITKGGLRVIHVNFHGGADGVALAPAPWNNVTGAPTAGNSIPDMLDHTGASSGIGIELLDTWDLEGNTGAASGVYPPEVTRSFYFENDMTAKHLKVSGLDITRTYSFEFFASRAGVSGQRLTHYTIGAQTVSLDAVNNTGEVARISGVLPDANGEVTIQVVKDAASSFAYINSLVIEENGVVEISPNNPPEISQLNFVCAPINTSSTINITANDLDGVDFLNGGSPDWTNKKIVVLGSSTAEGHGLSNYANAWVGKLESYVTQSGTGEVINLARGGITSDVILPSGDGDINIDKALTLNPDIIIVNMPTNDVAANIPASITIQNLTTVKNIAKTSGALFYITTTQPRNFSAGDTDKRNELKNQAQLFRDNFGTQIIDIYDELADESNDFTIKARYAATDGIHLVEIGHAYIFNEVIAKLNEKLTFTATNLPTFATLNHIENGLIELVLTPTTEDQGTYEQVEVVVTDTYGESNITTFDIGVHSGSTNELWAIANGDWNDPSTWSITEGGSAGNIVPDKNTKVNVKGFQVTISDTRLCSGVNIFDISEATSTLIISSSARLDVYGTVMLTKEGSHEANNAGLTVNGKVECLAPLSPCGN
ncbi:GDSL-type esterase/lipase family protein [Flammeovirgaceae bacterium SG7u.111]|nr:GDSL-type esterase/lipase family protein [Flammeovirgaceae bacterium SG7u.111]